VPKVHIVTDSAVTITPDVAEQLGITILPLTVHVDDDDSTARLEAKSETVEIYQDGTVVDHEELLLRMGSNRVHPSIVGPTADQFRRVYARLTRQTSQIISLHSSGSLSLICREARKAVELILAIYKSAKEQKLVSIG